MTFQKKNVLEVLVDNSPKTGQQFGMTSSKDKMILHCSRNRLSSQKIIVLIFLFLPCFLSIVSSSILSISVQKECIDELELFKREQ